MAVILMIDDDREVLEINKKISDRRRLRRIDRILRRAGDPSGKAMFSGLYSAGCYDAGQERL